MRYQITITKNNITAVLFIGMMMLLSSHISFAENTSASTNTIAVSGTASVTAPIFAIDIHISIETLEDTPQKAQTTNDKKVETLFKAITELGINKKHIETENIRLYPQYQYNYNAENPEDRKTLMGYQISNAITIRVEDQSKYGDLIYTLTTNTVDNINSIEYIMSSDVSYYNKALALAFENAKKKAESLAHASRNTIDDSKIIISESNTQSTPYPESKAIMMSASRESNTGIPQEQNIEATVYVTFFLLKK